MDKTQICTTRKTTSETSNAVNPPAFISNHLSPYRQNLMTRRGCTMSPSGPLEGNSRAGKIRSTLGSHEMKLGIRPRGRGKFVRMALAQRGDLRMVGNNLSLQELTVPRS